jgi:ribose transport system substrate-binding protein
LAGNFEASIAQDFGAMGAAAADVVAGAMSGAEQRARVIYVPTKMVTANNAGQ